MDEILFFLTGDTKTYTNHYIFNQKIIDRLDDFVTFFLGSPQVYAKQFSFCGDIMIRLNDILLHYSESIPNEKYTQTQLLRCIDLFCDLLTDGTTGVTFVPNETWMEANGVTIVNDHVVFPSVYDYEVDKSAGCSNYVVGKSFKYLGCKILLRLNYIIEGLSDIIPSVLTIDVDDTETQYAYTKFDNNSFQIKAWVNKESTDKLVTCVISNDNISLMSTTSDYDESGNKIYTFNFQCVSCDSFTTDITLTSSGNPLLSKTLHYYINTFEFQIDVNQDLSYPVEIPFVLGDYSEYIDDDLIIDFGDGYATTIADGVVTENDISHIYSSNGIYNIKIQNASCKMPSFTLGNSGSILHIYLIHILSPLLKTYFLISDYSPEIDGSILFNGAQSLLSIPNDIFDNNLDYEVLLAVFSFCPILNFPENFTLKKLVNVTNYFSAFSDCYKLKLHSNLILDESTEMETRFVDKLVYFNNIFDRLSADGDALGGTAPQLWNYIYGTIYKEGAFGSNGNNADTILNYNDIPSDWK
jgi:hypothetical protein